MNNDDLKWVFLSHSNKDYLQVRIVRNRLEDKGLYPIMFYLKCLENDPSEIVLEIIKKEIDARPRFILCQSENALKSYWVQKEIEYIKSINRPYEVVDLKDENSIIIGVNSLYKRMTILIISPRIEPEISKMITQKGFIEQSIDENMPVYNIWGGMSQQQYEYMVNLKCIHSLETGYCLLLLYTQSDYNSLHCQKILRIAKSNKRYTDYLIPVLMEQTDDVYSKEFRTFPNFFDASAYPNDKKVSAIVNHLLYVDSLKNV